MKRRILYALSRVGGEKELRVIIDAAQEKELSEYIETLLDDANPAILSRVIAKRINSEKNQEILRLLDSLQSRLEDSF